jgi:hypothetical protein
MYCPSCGANQADQKKFCTNCGTNLLAVSRALQGPPAVFAAPPAPFQNPIDRIRDAQRERRYASGVRLTIIGGAFLALQLLRFIFSWHLDQGSPFGFFSLVAIVIASIGISRIATSRIQPSIPQRQVTPSSITPGTPEVTPPQQSQETRMFETPPSVTEETTRHFQQERSTTVGS